VDIKEQQKDCGLVSCFRGFEGVMQKLEELLQNPDLKTETKRSRDRLIKEKSDLTAFMADFVETWHERKSHS